MMERILLRETGIPIKDSPACSASLVDISLSLQSQPESVYLCVKLRAEYPRRVPPATAPTTENIIKSSQVFHQGTAQREGSLHCVLKEHASENKLQPSHLAPRFINSFLVFRKKLGDRNRFKNGSSC